MLRTVSITIFLVCLATAEAFACRGEFSEGTILFDDVPISLDAPVIIEVTITDISQSIERSSGWALTVMNAHVNGVIREQLPAKQ